MSISSTRHLRRQSNLEFLIKENGGPSAFALLVDSPKSHISALTAGSRGIGDRLAAKIERKCGKPAGWLDEDHGLKVWAAAGSTSATKTPSEKAHELVLKMSLGEVALELAKAAQHLDEQDRDLIAQHIAHLVRNGPAARHAAAIDALATVVLPLSPTTGGSSFTEPQEAATSSAGAEDKTEHPAPVKPSTEIGIWHSEETPRRHSREVEIDLDRPTAAPGSKRKRA